MTDIKSFYKSRVEKLEQQFKRMGSRSRRISFLRLATFIIGLGLIYVASGYTVYHVIVAAVVFLTAFISAVIWHTKTLQRKDDLERLLQINNNEYLALQNKFSQFDGGSEFLHPDHPFADDLDIFGDGSIFQYINRSWTVEGKQRLAGWFSEPETDRDAIIQKQLAVKDLATRIDWRQNQQSTGLWLSEEKDDQPGLIQWVQKPAVFGKKIYRVLLWINPILSAFMLYLAIAGFLTPQLFVIYLLVPLNIAFSRFKKVGLEHEQVSRKSGLLKKFSRMFGAIEKQSFESPDLIGLRKKLFQSNTSASGEIRKLSKIVNALDSRLNVFGWVILNYFFLWDIMQSRRLDIWRLANRDNLQRWFDVLGGINAISSLSNLAYNRPAFSYPEPLEGDFQLEAEKCGHPLIPDAVRVDNQITLKGWEQFVIVTGANMAGKSTYLRTVAVNFILASTGSPVCAAAFRFTPVPIFTSIRTRDNLLQNESYFFAELKRLKAIIDILETGQKLFIILDEILKGTNSKDKQMGSKALLKQLIRFGASGLIATHDLSLGDLIHEFPENIRNKRFEVEIENDELLFDYLLKDGISQNLNATFLMKKMGITV